MRTILAIACLAALSACAAEKPMRVAQAEPAQSSPPTSYVPPNPLGVCGAGGC